jgi:hypothetical protein
MGSRKLRLLAAEYLFPQRGGAQRAVDAANDAYDYYKSAWSALQNGDMNGYNQFKESAMRSRTDPRFSTSLSVADFLAATRPAA